MFWYPEGSVQSSEATRDPHPFGKSVDLSGTALPRTTPLAPCHRRICHFHLFCGDFLGSTFFKICSLYFSSLRGIRQRPSAAGKAVSTQRGDLDDSEGASFGATVESKDSPPTVPRGVGSILRYGNSPFRLGLG